MITCCHIFTCAKHDKNLSLSKLQKLIKSKYTEHEMLSYINNVLIVKYKSYTDI